MNNRLGWLARTSAIVCVSLCLVHCSGNMSGDNGSAAASQQMPQSTGAPTTATPTPNNPNTTADPNTQSTSKGLDCNGLPAPCSTKLTAIPLTGCSTADYSAQVTLGGTQTLNLLVDTGSTTLAVAGADCIDCQGVTPTYMLSANAQDTGTAVSSKYGTGNGWSGTAVLDAVQVGASTTAVQMHFARITQQTATASGRTFFAGSDCTGNLTNNAQQGILGMGNAAEALTGTDTFLDVFKTANKTDDAFAFEACDNGGQLWLGGYDPNSVTAPPKFTPLDITHGYDIVTLQGIGIGGNQVGLTAQDFGQTIVDTGTSIFLLPPGAFDKLTQAIEADPNYSAMVQTGFLASSQFIVLQATRAAIDAQLPPMHLTFPGVGNQAAFTVDLPPTASYLAPYTLNGQAGYLSGLASVNSTPAMTLLGNSAMHSHVMVFDRANKQLGYAPHASCP